MRTAAIGISADLDMEGWLCPALFRYFDQAPKQLYAQVKALGSLASSRDGPRIREPFAVES
jgi:hypothetical protein